MTARGYSPARPDNVVPLRGSPANVLAHRTIDLNKQEDRDYLAAMTLGMPGSAAWKNFRNVGEVRYAITRSARIAGYATLFGEQLAASGTTRTAKADGAGVVAEEVAQITSNIGGLRGLIERFYVLRKVPGEMYLTEVVEGGEFVGYWFLSPSELSLDESQREVDVRNRVKWTTARVGSTITGERTAFHRYIEPANFKGRIWAPDYEYIDNVDTPMAAIGGLCNMLNRLTESIMERLNSRLMHAGLLLIPSEINDAAINAKQIPGENAYGTNDKVLRYLIHVMTQNVTAMQTGNAVARLPIMVKGPASALEALKHLTIDSRIDETDLKLRAELLDRIMDALDQQKQQITGQEGSNRFSAWRSADEERRITVQPDLESMCHALTVMVLWPRLRARGWPEKRVRRWRLWYDLSAAAVKANIVDDTIRAWEVGAVNHAFVRKAIGATELDAMSPEEWVRWTGIKVRNPILATYGLEGINVDWDKAGGWGKTSGPIPDNESSPGQENPGRGDPGAPGDRVDDQTPNEDG